MLYVIVLYKMTARYSHNIGDYECRICDKKYSRKYTLERHLVSIHGYLYKDYLKEFVNITEKTDTNCTILPVITDNLTDKSERDNQITNKSNTIDDKTCNKCNKTFSRKWDLKKHKETCKGIIDKFSCEYCNKKFTHHDSRYKHIKTCKKKKELDANALIAKDTKNVESQQITQQTANTINNNNTTNIENQNNTVNNNTVNNITVLAFPSDGDGDFEFDTAHISEQFMNKLLQKVQHPQFKFNNFFDKLMDNPKNRIIKKNSPNTSYSKIHQGDDKWDYGYDKDIYKTLTHHTTVAAFNKIENTRENNKAMEFYYNLKNFESYVKEVNEMDYDSSEYNDILQRIKLIVVNLTKKWEELDIS